VIEIEENSSEINIFFAGASSIVGKAGTSSVLVGVCRADMTCTVGMDASKMVRDRKDGSAGIVEGYTDRSLESCNIRDDLVRFGIFNDKLKRCVSDEYVSVFDRVLIYGKLMYRSVSCAKYFCVSIFINVMVHAMITRKIKLKSKLI
jgi:hypothetical protein